MRRTSARSSSPSSPAPRRQHHRRGFRPAVSRLEDRTLLSLNPTSISVTASPAQVVYGQPVTLTANVSEIPPGGTTPTGGSVTFYDGSTTLGSASLNNGVAALTTSLPMTGGQMISAAYSGDGQNFAGSNVGVITTYAGDWNSAATRRQRRRRPPQPPAGRTRWHGGGRSG